MKNFKSGYISIIGKPNVGKSTLLNSILEFNLSSVSPKPQMTRHRILGISESIDYQMIFIDTPGILKPRYTLQTIMMNEVKKSVFDSDITVLVIEPNENDEISLEYIKNIKNPIILCINKIDKFKDKKELLPVVEKWEKLNIFNHIILISALKEINLVKLKNEILNYLPYGPLYFDKGTLTDRTERFYITEIIRESAYKVYNQEIPYAIAVVVDEFHERVQGKYYIKAFLYVEQLSQKQIVIGKSGRLIKILGSLSREKIEKFISHKVYLELIVKIMPKWRKKLDKIQKFGY